METITYYEVSFKNGSRICPLMEDKNFKEWEDAVKYMNDKLDNAIEDAAQWGKDEEVISDAERTNPFEPKLSMSRQVVMQGKNCFCHIYNGSVIRRRLFLN